MYSSFVRLISKLGSSAMGAGMLLGFSMNVWSQATSGGILGRVVDPSGFSVPAASVVVRNSNTGLERATRTDAEGDYAVPNLPPGNYVAEIESPGFKKLTRGPVKLTVDQKLRLDLQLHLGELTEVVTVTSEAPLLDTETAATGEVIQSRQILDLPLLGRNFLELARLAPGVAAGAGGNNVNLAVSGQREFGNSLLVDGVEVSGNRNNDTSLRPSVDAVEEFKVLTSGYAPEFGRASGGVISIQTKAGSNETHGSLYEFLRPHSTAARSFFSPKPAQLKQNNFGGSLGAAISRNRTFLFGSYESVRLRDAFSYLDTTVPKSMVRFDGGAADLSGLQDPGTGNPIPVFDPDFYAENFYAQPFPNNAVPASRVSDAGRAVYDNFFPAPNMTGTFNGWFSNFVVNQPFRFDSDTYDTRFDHLFSGNNHLSVVYHLRKFDSLLGDRFTGAIPVDGGGDADAGDRIDTTNQSVAATYSHIVSPTGLNELRVAYSRFSLLQTSLLHGRNLADEFGLANINILGFDQTSGFPNIFLGFGAQTGGSTFKPLAFVDNNVQVTNNFLWRRGNHDMKFGADLRRLASAPSFSLFPTGFMFFAGFGASLTADPNYSFFDADAFYQNGGNEVADLLLGLPQTVTTGLQLTRPRVRTHEAHFYWQDAWQITPRLTLTYGVRYEFQAPYSEKDGQAANFDLSTRRLLLAGRGGHRSSLLEPDRNNFAPRLGFAYRITNKTVVRGGYGVFYSPENSARNELLTKNYPFATQQDFFNDIFGFYSGGYKTYVLDTGVPRDTVIAIAGSVTAIDPSEIANGKNLTVIAVAQHFRTGYSQLFNFTLQRRITPSMSVEAAYVGSLARKLPYGIGDVNRNERLTAQVGKIQAQFPVGLSNYHSLQVKAERRLSKGLSSLFAYTFGKSIDNGPAPFNLNRNNQRPQNPFNLRAERAVSENDIRHNVVWSAVYELPFGRGRQLLTKMRPLTEALLGGWQVNGILAFRSGLPVNVIRNGQRRGLEGLRPNVIGDPDLPGSERSLERYFDTAAFTIDGLGDTEPGNAGRNILRGLGFKNLDFSVFKEFPFNERVELQLRFEFFNLTNTPNFSRPNGDFSRGDFGSVTQSTGNPRIIQFAAKIHF